MSVLPPIWKPCADCGREFQAWYLCKDHGLCGPCHPEEQP